MLHGDGHRLRSPDKQVVLNTACADDRNNEATMKSLLPSIGLKNVRNTAWLVMCSVVAFATTASAVPLRAGLPMMIEADTFEIDMTTRKATWTGNVIASQAGHEIRTEHFTITLAQQDHDDQNADDSNSGDAPASRDAVIIEAGHLGYHHDGRELTSSGGTVIKRGESRIEAHTLIYRFEQQLAVAAPDDSGRVHVVLTMAEDAPIQLASNSSRPLSGAQ